MDCHRKLKHPFLVFLIPQHPLGKFLKGEISMPINSDNQNKNQPQQNQAGKDTKRPMEEKAPNRKDQSQFQSPESDKRVR
jgi:hypothetical protein